MHTQKHTIATIARLHLLPFVFLLGIAFAPLSAEAKSVMWTEQKEDFGPGGSSSLGTVVVHSPIFQVTYTASVRNLDTNVLLSDGEVVPVSTRLRFEPKPYEDTDTFWFRTGGVYDSPYGYFTENAGPPPQNQQCSAEDILTGHGSGTWFASFTVAPPGAVSVTQSGSANLSCDSSGRECTVNSEGTIISRVSFDETIGKVYLFFTGNAVDYGNVVGSFRCALNPHRTGDRDGATYRLTISTQTIPFRFSAGAAAAAQQNRPPNPPVIMGPTIGKTGDVHRFSVRATDPDNDFVRYGIDWDMDNFVDQWLPFGGYTASGASEPFSRTWSVIGVKTFQALAEDEWGLRSGWTAHAIEIIQCPSSRASYSCALSGPSCEDPAYQSKKVSRTASCIRENFCDGLSESVSLSECVAAGVSCADVPEQCGRPDTTFREF